MSYGKVNPGPPHQARLVLVSPAGPLAHASKRPVTVLKHKQALSTHPVQPSMAQIRCITHHSSCQSKPLLLGDDGKEAHSWYIPNNDNLHEHQTRARLPWRILPHIKHALSSSLSVQFIMLMR
jgi:hypothetical protein